MMSQASEDENTLMEILHRNIQKANEIIEAQSLKQVGEEAHSSKRGQKIKKRLGLNGQVVNSDLEAEPEPVSESESEREEAKGHGKKRKIQSESEVVAPKREKRENQKRSPRTAQNSAGNKELSNVRERLRKRLETLTKKSLSKLMEIMSLPYAMNINKPEMIEKILQKEHEAVEFSCKELQAMYVERNHQTMRCSSKAKMANNLRKILPDFENVKRQAMGGFVWLDFVASMLDFMVANTSNMDKNFNFLFWSLKTDLEDNDVETCEPQIRQRIIDNWNFIQLLPHINFVDNVDDINAIKMKMDEFRNVDTN